MAHTNESWQIYKFDACAHIHVAEVASEFDIFSFLQNITFYLTSMYSFFFHFEK